MCSQPPLLVAQKFIGMQLLLPDALYPVLQHFDKPGPIFQHVCEQPPLLVAQLFIAVQLLPVRL